MRYWNVERELAAVRIPPRLPAVPRVAEAEGVGAASLV
jgi:hypothetical protein